MAAAGAAGAAAYYVYKRWTWGPDDADEPSGPGVEGGGTLVDPRGTAATARRVSRQQGGVAVVGCKVSDCCRSIPLRLCRREPALVIILWVCQCWEGPLQLSCRPLADTACPASQVT